tara:strand:- start:17 stop:1312 length:1296 start_codon:yes stop_codon:yes gene_type:complete
MNNLGDSNLKEKYLLGLKTAGFFYCGVSVYFLVVLIFFPWLSNKQLLTYLITWQIIAAIVQGTIAYFANTKNYNLFTILLVAEVTLHALIVIGLQTADLSSDVSINSNNILGRQAIEIFIMPVLFMILCILFFRPIIFYYFAGFLTFLLLLGLSPIIFNTGVFFTIEREIIYSNNLAIDTQGFSGSASLFFWSFAVGIAIIWQANKHAKSSASFEKTSLVLSRYFSPEIKEEIENSDLDFDNQNPKDLDVAILFTDIVGFTKLSEKMPPKDILKLLSGYQAIMIESIFENKGTVDKFIGDAVMANFGTPKSSGNDAQNAFNCALSMNKKLKNWNNSRLEQGLSTIEHRIGIHFGPCVVGNIGNEQRTEFAIIGDPVNVASRICDACKKFDTNLIISQDVANRIKIIPKSEIIENFEIRGRKNTIDLVKIYS